MFDYPIYILFRAIIALLNLLPLKVLFALGEAGGSIAWAMAWSYRSLALRNVRLAFGNTMTEPDARKLVHRHFRRISANVLAGIKLSSMPIEQLAALISTENLEPAEAAFAGRRPVVLVLSHLGNWEMLAQLLPKYGPDVRKSTVYQTLRNRFIDEYIRKVRSRTGLELFERSKGFKGLVELLRGGGGVGILSDQHAGNHGVWTPFFGRLASTTSLPALLAKRTGAALVPAAMYTDGKARWRLVFETPIDSRSGSIEELTATLNRVVEAQIRRAPEDWFWVHNRWKTPIPNFLLQNYKRGIFVGDAASLKPFRILIRASNWLGDSVMSMPAIRAIKRGRPDAHITIAAPAKLAPLWQRISDVDEVIALPAKSLFQTVRTLKVADDFDVAVLFTNSLRSALEVWLLGVPARLGFAGHHRRWLLHRAIREPRQNGPPEHQSNRYLHLARRLGATASGELPEVRQNQKSEIRNQKFLLGLCPGAEYGPAKRWLPERFAEAANEISAQTGAHWLLFGTEKEREIGEAIATSLGEKSTNRIGKTSLDELMDELAQCRLLLSNDTGTMHLAALLRVPTVAIFGSTEPALTGPMGGDHSIIRRHVECSPCFLRECPIDFRCMREVTVVEVVAALLTRLA